MIGAIVGDIVGSIYEFNNHKSKDFPLFSERSAFTDDSLCTIAVADCLMADGDPAAYREIDHAACVSGKAWHSVVMEQCRDMVKGRSKAAAKNHVRQLNEFYKASSDETIWITFSGGCLWWCFAANDIKELSDSSRQRSVSNRWSNCDINGQLLTFDTLNGHLLATLGFRGTICEVKERDYLLDKINGRVSPAVSGAQRAIQGLASALIPLIQKLNPNDFEVLMDLIFRQGGFYRTGRLGGTQKVIDLDLINPVSKEKVLVQVKSRASKKVFLDYQNQFSDMAGGYSRFVFATHSPEGKWATSDELAGGDIEIWLVDKIAEHAARLGLAGWLIDKAI